jgi:hypothetical protein
MATEIRIKLLKLVLNNPEIKRDEIHAHKDFEDEEDRTLANLLYNTKKDGQIVCDESLRYTITAKGRNYLGLKGGESKAPAAPKSKQRATPHLAPQRTGNGVEQILVEAEEHAQGALDRYLTTVGDPGIIGPLRSARDSAREALKNYREKPGS